MTKEPMSNWEHRTRGSRTQDDQPIVLHVDADCFYASCERLREPDLRGEPVVVGMGYEPAEAGGAVATASYEARAFGVESAMAIDEALEVLPRRIDGEADPDIDVETCGYYRPVDMAFYESVSEEVREILHDCADVVREVSIDEAYLDVTERTAWEVADGFARHVKDRVRREVGVTVSVGVAPTMSAAKIASDFDKPDGLTVVGPGEVQSFLDPLSVERLHGVGPVTAETLREREFETIGDVAAADAARLEALFGERGRDLVSQARGTDDRPVEPTGRPKSFSRESAVKRSTGTSRYRERIETLAEAVAERASREGALYRTIGVKAVRPPYEVSTRERSLPGPVDDPKLVVEIARALFAEFEDDPVRKLGVRVSNLEFTSAEQVDLEGFTDAGTTNSEPTSNGDGQSLPAPDEDGQGTSHPTLPSGQSTLADFADGGRSRQ